jgi:hypothetical protein
MKGSKIPASVTISIDQKCIFEWSIQTNKTQNSFINAESMLKFGRPKLVRVICGKFTGRQHHSRAMPQLTGLYLANGFSGHGLQQGPLVGSRLSELISA